MRYGHGRNSKWAKYRDRRRCWYCGLDTLIDGPTRDHQTPLSRGGSDAFENLVLACKHCNNEKGNMDVETYRYFLRDQRPLGERMVFFGEVFPEMCLLVVPDSRADALTFTIGDIYPDFAVWCRDAVGGIPAG